LLEALRREVPDVHIVGVELPGVGLCIRYAPLEIGDSKYQCHGLLFHSVTHAGLVLVDMLLSLSKQ